MRWLRSLVVIAFVIGASAVPVAASATRETPRPAYGPQDLHTRVTPTGGWGFGPGNITDPGPTITVNTGESVSLNLFAADTIDHRFLLDLDGDTFPTAGEPISPRFSSPSTPLAYGFTNPSTPGTYQYICGIHGTAQRGTWVIRAANQPPTMVLTTPNGVTPLQWTGGSTHQVRWTATDPDGLASQLIVYLNYTYNAGANGGTIAGPTTNLGSFDWTVPLIDATDVRVLATAIEPGPGGLSASDSKLLPTIDSTRPAVTATVPANGAANVPTTTPLDVVFSEAMNRPTAEAAVSLCEMPGCTAVPLTFVSWTGNTLRMQPASTLTANALYQATVSNAARDASDPGNAMAAPHVWSFRTVNTAPAISVISPTATTRWTGGVDHTIAWSATDAEDPQSALTVWVNYSATGSAPWTPVVGPVPGTQVLAVWTFPADDTATAKIEVTAVDTAGARTVAPSPAFVVDSTPPTVSSTSPAEGATGVALTANMLATFSEAMNTAVTGHPSVVALREVGSGAWIPMTYSWDGLTQTVTANPLPLLAPLTAHRLYVNASAQDAADPGLTMITGVTVNFTTSATPDTTPPTIASVLALPSSQVSGGAVEISATVTDDDAVALVTVDVTLPDLTTVNLTMASEPGNRWAVSQAWTLPGSYPFVVWALDASGNADSASASFTITALDTTPPTIAHTRPASAQVGQPIPIRATVTDDDAVANVWLVYTDVAGPEHNVSMTLQAGQYTFTIPPPSAAGTIRYRIWAEDATGNVNVTQEYALPVQGQPTTDYTPILLVLILLIAAVLVAATLLMRKRKKGEEKPPAP